MLRQSNTRNKILASLEESDFALLQPDLASIELPVGRQLETRNRPIRHVYFLEAGLASMVASSGANQSIEVGIVGNEGMTGLPILLHSDRGTYETFIQSAGSGSLIAANKLRGAIKAREGLQRVFLRYAHTLVTQMASTALANGRFKVEERLARWLLMASDRSDDGAVHLTHEFLALMMGTRRAGVTTTLNELQKSGIITKKRGVIVITDREALQQTANGSYGAPEAEYQRLFPPLMGIRSPVFGNGTPLTTSHVSLP